MATKEIRIKKCDFCIMCEPNGKCHYAIHAYREEYCKEAIKKMSKALQNKGK